MNFKSITAIPLIIPIDSNKSLSTIWGDADRVEQVRLHEMVTTWCRDNNLLISNATGSDLIPNMSNGNAVGRLGIYLYSINIKVMNECDVFDTLVRVLRDTEYDRLSSRLLDLYIQVCVELDAEFVNIYVNKIKYMLVHIAKITTPLADTPEYPWDMVFDTMPHIWLVYVIQNILRSHTPLQGE